MGLSNSAGNHSYNNYIKSQAAKFHTYNPKDLYREPVHRWFSPGFVEPVWVVRNPNNNLTHAHSDLSRLAASATMILQKKPNTTKSIPLSNHTCVAYPYALLLGVSSSINIS